jgi:hypothetical protein
MPQEALAKIVGTTPAKVDFFIKKLKKSGFIEDDGPLKISNSLLSVVLHDGLSVLSHSSKEAIVAMLGPGDFLGEGALAGHPFV